MDKSLGDIGRFLLLAVFLPGLVYVISALFYFPNMVVEIDQWVNKNLAVESTWLVWGAFTIGSGLLLSSICFAIEIPLHKSENFNKLFPILKVSCLAKFEAEGKSTSCLNQLLGQAFMHFNIWMGLLIIWLVWFLIEIFCDDIWKLSNIVRLALGPILVIVNFFVASNFYKWAGSALEDVEHSKVKREGGP